MENKVKLYEICDDLSDGLHAAPLFNPDGEYLFVNAINLENGYIVDTGDGKRADYSEYVKYKIDLNKRTILYSIDGTIGKIAKYRGEKVILGKGACYIKLKESVNADYIYYLLQSALFQGYLKSMTTGSTIHHISLETMRNFSFELPPRNVQDCIAGVLSTLDAKIDNNNHLCAELEAMAKNLYDYWFVQFDFPDENGKPYRTSGGAMEWSKELGREVPKGWKIDTIDHIISIVRGVSYQPSDELSSLDEDSIKLLKSNNIQDGSINFDSPVYLPSEKANSEQWLTKGSVFITMSSGSKLHMGKTAIVFDDLPYVFGAFCAKIKIESLYQYWLAVYFRHELFRTHIENVTLGTSINNINAYHITSIKMAFPPKEILEQFNAVLSPCFDMQGKIMKENTQLQNMRDWLLPMLMNGQAIVEQ